jgi:hypothetical protein
MQEEKLGEDWSMQKMGGPVLCILKMGGGPVSTEQKWGGTSKKKKNTAEFFFFFSDLGGAWPQPAPPRSVIGCSDAYGSSK